MTPRGRAWATALVTLACCALAGPAVAAARPAPPAEVFPSPASVRAARQYLHGREGRVSFAVLGTDRRLRGVRVHARFRSASLVKAMILVAYLRSHAGRPIGGRERALLGPMITRSNNRAARRVFGPLGPEPLRKLARKARMRRFSIAGYWSSAKVTAADQARFFRRLDELTPRRHRRYARHLLSSIVAEQSWGVPAAAPPGWRVFFKGGWLRDLAHQAALLEGDGHRVSLAILTDRDPSQAYGFETVHGVAVRLLADPPSPPRPPAIGPNAPSSAVRPSSGAPRPSQDPGTSRGAQRSRAGH